MNSVHYSNNSDEWSTPAMVYDYLDQCYGPFTLDAAATPENTKCLTYFTRADDALRKKWQGRVWLNPPYSRLAAFCEKAIQETASGRAEVVVMLVPARTDTVWWREATVHAAEVIFHSGRLKFGSNKSGNGNYAPFPSAAFIFNSSRTWSKLGNVRFTMPKRHGTRESWYTMHLSHDKSVRCVH